MKTLALALSILLLAGCSWLSTQSVEVCVLYKGKKICASKVDGKWSFNVALTPDEEKEIVEGLEK